MALHAALQAPHNRSGQFVVAESPESVDSCEDTPLLGLARQSLLHAPHRDSHLVNQPTQHPSSTHSTPSTLPHPPFPWNHQPTRLSPRSCRIIRRAAAAAAPQDEHCPPCLVSSATQCDARAVRCGGRAPAPYGAAYFRVHYMHE